MINYIVLALLVENIYRTGRKVYDDIGEGPSNSDSSELVSSFEEIFSGTSDYSQDIYFSAIVFHPRNRSSRLSR